jgi:nitroreductase
VQKPKRRVSDESVRSRSGTPFGARFPRHAGQSRVVARDRDQGGARRDRRQSAALAYRPDQRRAACRVEAIVAAKLVAGETEEPAYQIYPAPLTAPYRDRRFAVGEAMYGEVGIPREGKMARRMWFARNFQFFGAPAALFCTVDRQMGPPQWADLGMYLQTVMLLAVEAGLATCPQECWAVYPETITSFLGTPAERMLFCGMAIGYEDTEEPANRLRSSRAPQEEWLTVRT